MNQHEYIKNFNELEFAVFCIKNVAKNWGGECCQCLSGIYRKK